MRLGWDDSDIKDKNNSNISSVEHRHLGATPFKIAIPKDRVQDAVAAPPDDDTSISPYLAKNKSGARSFPDLISSKHMRAHSSITQTTANTLRLPLVLGFARGLAVPFIHRNILVPAKEKQAADRVRQRGPFANLKR
jgi:hypothetical protein